LDRVRRMCCWLRWKKGTRMQFYQPLYDLRSLWRRRHQPPYTHYLPLYPHTLAELAIPSLPCSPPLNLAKPATYPHSPHSLTLRRSLLLPPLNSRNYARLARDLAFQARNTWKSQLGYAVFWNESFKTIEPALLSLLLQLLPLLRWSSVRHLKTHKSHFPTPLPLNNPLAPSLHVLHPLMYVTIAPRPALAEGNVLRLPRLDEPVLYATVGRQPQEKVIKSKQITGQGKAANEKISAARLSCSLAPSSSWSYLLLDPYPCSTAWATNPCRVPYWRPP